MPRHALCVMRMSGGEAVTEREFEDALRTFQTLWEAKGDLERQLGDERRRTEKLRNQISEQLVAQEKLRDDLRAAQRTGEEQERQAERDRETVLALEQQLAEGVKGLSDTFQKELKALEERAETRLERLHERVVLVRDELAADIAQTEDLLRRELKGETPDAG